MTEKEAFLRARRAFDQLVALDLLDLLARYPGPFLNDSLLPPQIQRIAHTEAGVFSEHQLILILLRHWIWLQHHWQTLSEADLLRGRYKSVNENVCVFCGEKVLLSIQGQRIQCGQCDDTFDRELWEL